MIVGYSVPVSQVYNVLLKGLLNLDMSGYFLSGVITGVVTTWIRVINRKWCSISEYFIITRSNAHVRLRPTWIGLRTARLNKQTHDTSDVMQSLLRRIIFAIIWSTYRSSNHCYLYANVAVLSSSVQDIRLPFTALGRSENVISLVAHAPAIRLTFPVGIGQNHNDGIISYHVTYCLQSTADVSK